jgi:hypothetical protein
MREHDMQNDTNTTAPRYDVQSLTVDMTGVHYGPITTHGVQRAIGPVAHRGYVLVADGHRAPFEVLAAQLRRSA